MSQSTLATLRKQDSLTTADIRAGFDTASGFELIQRGAKLLSSSTIVPSQYRNIIEKKNGQSIENPAGISNCVVALNMAQRMGADPLMIMQNLYIVEGRPSWSSQYVIASINACGKYSPLRFELEKLGEKEVEYTHIKWEGQYPNKQRVEIPVKAKIQDVKCVAWARELISGERLESPPVTIELAVQEGWYGKEGSKWKTMPEVMLRYRAASFFGKLYAPELLMGIQTSEEVHDTYVMEQDKDGIYTLSVSEMKEAREAEKAKEDKKDNNISNLNEHSETVKKTVKNKEPQAVSKDLKFISCPRLEDQEVSTEACQTCSSRQGCPSHED